MDELQHLFSLEGKVAVVTGGTGVLGGAMVRGLAMAGARVAILGRRAGRAEAVAAEIGVAAMPLPADVLSQESLEAARQRVLERWGAIDILVNAAGGNIPGAALPTHQNFFHLGEGGFERVLELNLLGTVLPSRVFGQAMADRAEPRGCIVNISSVNGARPLTRTPGYAAAKAAVENFTRWLAVDLALHAGPGMRVNCIAPGFFVAEQNRGLLVNPDGSLTPRGQAAIDHTPLGRFGRPEDLISTLIWLCGDGASFVTGAVIPVDGGVAVFPGV